VELKDPYADAATKGWWFPLALIWGRHAALLTRLCRRELESRYRGSVLGIVWLILAPVISLALYMFVFSVMSDTRWPLAGGERGSFAVVVLYGLSVYWFFAESISRAPTLIQENSAYVTKIIFPLEVLTPAVAVVGALGFLISSVPLAVVYLFFFGAPPVTALVLPIVLVPLFLMTLGIGWLLASLGVFVRDIRQVVGLLLAGVLFLAPVFYPLSQVPERMRGFLYLNPLTVPVDLGRRVLFEGVMPNWNVWFVYTLAALAISSFGYLWFMRTKLAFADVL